MVRDDRFKLLSFTGSPSVGWKMKAEAGKKKVVLELGGNAGAMVDETADLDWAINRLVYGSFAYAGQVCISVQRIYVVESIFDDFARRFTDKVRSDADRQPARSGDGPGTDGRREGGQPHAPMGAGGAGRGRTRPDRRRAERPLLPADRAGRRAEGGARLRRGGFRPGRQPVQRAGLRRRAGRRSTTRSSGCSAASSPTTWSGRCRPTTSWRSAA